MKRIFLLILVMLYNIVAIAQLSEPRKSVNVADSWSTWLLDNPEKIIVAAPPDAEQSKAELNSIKRKLSGHGEKKLAKIKYWNAGAPGYRWNQIANNLISKKTEVALRIPSAWLNLAIYDATILCWRAKFTYKRERPSVSDPSLRPILPAPLSYSYPCEHSVTAAAAAYVISYFFPEAADSILQLANAASQSRVDAGVQYPSDAEEGWKLGEQVGKLIVEKAKQDGSANVWNGSMNRDPEKWTGVYPFGITLASFTPIVVRRSDQFRPPKPPDFAEDMKELKNFKVNFKAASLAYYWANNGPELWFDIASQKIFEYRMEDDVPAAARIYAVLYATFHDASIAAMDAKYTYWGIRPDQFDPGFKPLISTPPFPGYPSAHAVNAAASSTVLEYFFPEDANQFRQLAKECAESRFYGGIHFRTDNEVGLKMGEAIGKYVVKTWMKT